MPKGIDATPVKAYISINLRLTIILANTTQIFDTRKITAEHIKYPNSVTSLAFPKASDNSVVVAFGIVCIEKLAFVTI